HESDGALSGARGAARHPDQPDAARGLGTRLRRDAAPDLGVGEHAAADREPARAPPLADVGPLVQDPRHRRRRPRVLRRRGAVAGREPAARGRPLTGEAAERVHLPRPHRGRPLVSLSLYPPDPTLTRPPPFGWLLGLLYSGSGFAPAWVATGEWSEETRRGLEGRGGWLGF
uniref:Uncharacterized protein n=1 Tax=Zea mays TaxID=4577 RepID=A0A804LN50_MAIZE